MKKTLLFCLSFLLSFSVSFAQQQKDHKKTTYQKDGKYYINKDLPVYLHLSTSADGSENKHRLESKETKQYANPLYFDTEGLNTIRTPYAVDPETKKTVYPQRDVVFEVYADGLAPNSSAKFYGAPSHYSSGTLYYGRGLQVDLSSKDGVSGVKQIYESLNGKNYSDYSGTINMNKEGKMTFKYYAVDNVGNFEKPNSKEYVVDLTNPKTSHSTSQPKLNDILSPKAKITLSKSDNLSGVKTTYYAFDSRGKKGYYSPISLWSLSDGNHTLTYYTVDNVNNQEQKRTYTFYLDKTPPNTNNDIVGDFYQGKYKYISVRTKIKLTSSDNKAGVREISYLIDGTGKTTYSNTIKMPESNGLHYLTYYATDKVTNKESANKLTVYMDSKDPKSYIKYGSPQFFHRDTLFINKNTNVYLSSNDYQSGVKKTEYLINDKSKTTYNSAFKISDEGYHTIKFYATDRVNNVESAKTSSVYVDNTSPKIYHNFSINAIGKKSKDGKTLKVYPNYTRLYLGATDTHSGTDKIKYRINGGAWEDYSSPYTLDISELDHFKKNAFYSVEVITKDKLGNESTETIEFFVSDE